MIDLDSAAAVARAAHFAHQKITAEIIAEPHGPIVTELQNLADDLEALVKDNAHTIAVLERSQP